MIQSNTHNFWTVRQMTFKRKPRWREFYWLSFALNFSFACAGAKMCILWPFYWWKNKYFFTKSTGFVCGLLGWGLQMYVYLYVPRIVLLQCAFVDFWQMYTLWIVLARCTSQKICLWGFAWHLCLCRRATSVRHP